MRGRHKRTSTNHREGNSEEGSVSILKISYFKKAKLKIVQGSEKLLKDLEKTTGASTKGKD
jgi:hypothetical protein